MKNGLTKFILSAAIVVAVVIAADWTIGKIIEKMLPGISNQGDTGLTYFSLNEIEYPVLIVGSSRANHHYVPHILSDSLDAEAYNIGRDGCFFSYNCCIIQSILSRYTPKMIIWETSMTSLCSGNDPLENLYPYYGKNKYVTECIKINFGWMKRIPLVCNQYKYNSLLIRIISRYINRKSFAIDELNGYSPISPKSWTPAEKENSSIESLQTINESNVQHFKDVLAMANSKGVRLIVVNSPSYMAKGNVSESEKIMNQICDSMGVSIYNFSQAEGIYDNIDFWNDYTHMNSRGAEVYTKIFIDTILSNGYLH